MLIKLYILEDIEYQKFYINEYDITYNNLLKYINLPKHSLYDELDESKKIWDKVFIKTIVNLFSYNSGEIMLDMNKKINCKFRILFSYEYYINHYYSSENKYKKIENNIKNYDNIIDAINNDPWQIIFIDSDYENYKEICKLAVSKNGYTIQCIDPELINEEIYKLAFQQNWSSLEFVKKQTEEMCKLAVSRNYNALQFVKPELMTEEICKLAVQHYSNDYEDKDEDDYDYENDYDYDYDYDYGALKYIKPEFMTDEICKLSVIQNGLSLRFVKLELMTDEICKLAVQNDGRSLEFVKKELMTDEICKLAVQEDGCALQYVKSELMTDEICKLAVINNGYAIQFVKKNLELQNY